MLKHYSRLLEDRAAYFLCTAAIVTALGASASFAQEENTEDLPVTPPGVIEIENDAVVEAGRGEGVVIENGRGRAKIAGPAGVVIAVPDEEIIIEGKPRLPGSPDAPKPPAIRKRVRINDGGSEAAIERRLSRLERRIEQLAEREQGVDGRPFAFEGKEFARVQREIDRAMRDADVAVKRMHRGHGGKDHFEFGQKFEFEGNAKMQRKVLEAQRKALEKQMKALDKQMEALEKLQEEGAEGEGEVEFESNVEKEKDESQGSEPALPPEAAPKNS